MGCLLLWPFAAIFGLIGGALGVAGKITGWVLGAVGSMFGLLFALVVFFIGIALCATIIGAIFGIPLILFAVGLAFRAIF